PGLSPLSLHDALPIYAAAPTIFTFADRGGVSWQSSGKPEAPLAVGYAKIVPNSGNTSPSGLATFAIRQNGVLVSEAGVPASPLIDRKSTRLNSSHVSI